MKRIGMLVLFATLTATGASAQAADVAWRPAHALTEADTFALRANGSVIGTQVVTLSRSDDGYVFTETTTVPAGSQTTEVRMSEALEMRQASQRGQMRGQDIAIRVTYADGRAFGAARIPGRDGMREVMVDAAVPTQVVDDNVFAALLPALAWNEGITRVVPVFSAGQNELRQVTLAVTGRERVSVPAGEYEVYRVEASGGAVPIVYYVSAVLPRRLVRIEVSGTPVDVVRVSP